MKPVSLFVPFLVLSIGLGAGIADQAASDSPERTGVLPSKVDFGYAFSTPHRMTVARPDSSDKTLLDLEPGFLKLVWTYDNLLNMPLAAFVTPTASWGVKVTPQIAGAAFPQSKWTRMEGSLPAVLNTYEDPRGTVRLEVVGSDTAALVRVSVSNTSADTLPFSLLCESQRGFFGYNPGYVDPVRDRDCLLAGWGDRADRVLVCAVGADECVIAGPTQLCPTWQLQPGETKTAWLIRPYRGYAADLPDLRTHNWQEDFDASLTEWRALLARAARVNIPDPGVCQAFYACLSELFIMREPVAEGYIAATPGTDGYRAPNAGRRPSSPWPSAKWVCTGNPPWDTRCASTSRAMTAIGRIPRDGATSAGCLPDSNPGQSWSISASPAIVLTWKPSIQEWRRVRAFKNACVPEPGWRKTARVRSPMD